MKRLTFTNQKGGIGKTCIAVNVTRFLNENFKKKIIFFDLDVQGNATYSLGNYNSENTVYDFFSRELTNTEITKISDMALNKNIVVIKASDDLANDITDVEKTVSCFNANLEKFNEVFDFAIFDTPPTLGNILVTTLLLSENIAVPMELDFFAVQGFSKFYDTYNTLKQVNDKLNYLGIIINKFQKQRKSQRELLEQIINNKITPIFESTVKSSSSIQNALSNSCSIKDLRKLKMNVDNRAINELYALTREVLSKIE